MSWDAPIRNALQGRRVFVTGHTGFKGSWLVAWLRRYDCRITGYALDPDTQPNLFELAGIERHLDRHVIADVRDAAQLGSALQASQPELVFHLAAQPLVRKSYVEPGETWATNLMGTVNLLEAIRSCPAVKAVVAVTTDKCYENREWPWGYREIDPLGGHDPYSASKAAAELALASYRRSFFPAGGPRLASARAGNVIGGGDWSQDRLIPDAVRALAARQPLRIRSPNATRPWQHVLDCLQGYLRLAVRLLHDDDSCATAFNFGPAVSDNRPVSDILASLKGHLPALEWQAEPEKARVHEANYLYLDSSLARQRLDWSPRWNLDAALDRTAAWYGPVMDKPGLAPELTERELDAYLAP